MKRSSTLINLPLFVFWPFGSFLMACRSIKSGSSALVYVLFSTLFGYSFTFNNVGADSYRLALVFNSYTQTSSLQDTIALFIEGGITDIYLKLSILVIRQFTDNPKVLFAWFGFVFGIFSYLSIRLLVNLRKGNNSIMLFMIALVFFSFYPLSTVNGVRFNTAALIFFCSVVNIFIYKNKFWLIALICTIFIHYSYLLIVPVILFLWLLQPYFNSDTKKFEWVYIIFFITLFASMVIPTNFFSLGFLQDSELISSSVATKFDIYNSDEAILRRAERLDSSLFLNVSKYFGYIMKVFIFFLVLQIKRNTKKLSIPKEYIRFYFVILLFLSFGFLASTIPSGGRFLSNGYMLFYFMFYQLYDMNRLKVFKRFINFMPLVYAFQIFYTILYLSISLTETSIWYGNLFWILFL